MISSAFYVSAYFVIWPFAFYFMARRFKSDLQREENPGLQLAIVSTIWPLIAAGFAMWLVIEFTTRAVNFFGRPFDKFAEWAWKR